MALSELNYFTDNLTSNDSSGGRFVKVAIGSMAATGQLIPDTSVSGVTSAITDNAAHDVIAAGGAGIYNYITQILVTNSHASTGTLVTIRDSDGTAIYSGYAAAAGGGFSCSFPTPLKSPASNKKVQAICGTTGANVYVSINGFQK